MDEILKKQINEIWDAHISANQFVLDGDGIAVNNIDNSRLDAIEVIKVIIRDFISDEINLMEFKSALDVFNRHNNLWNFSAKMGQMYFNLLLKSNEDNMEKLSTLLKNVISEPKDLKDALKKIEELEKFTNTIFLNAEDKRKVPYPGSVGYFLSYFWQVHNPDKWPIIYSSLINGFREIGIWKDQTTQKAGYNFFYALNDELKATLREHSGKDISNWDIEHTFWNYKQTKNPYQTAPSETTNTTQTETPKIQITGSENEGPSSGTISENATYVKDTTAKTRTAVNFDIDDYLIPKVARLFQVKEDPQQSDLYEKLVTEVFKQMEFEVIHLPQGPRKNPHAIIKFREENTAFLIDIKMDSVDYFSITDDRALKESIKDHCKELKKEGFKKTGFIVICNSFEGNYDSFINYISWHTDINKMILMTSDALLYLLAYKTKEKIRLEAIVETISNFSPITTSGSIIDCFEKA